MMYSEEDIRRMESGFYQLQVEISRLKMMLVKAKDYIEGVNDDCSEDDERDWMIAEIGVLVSPIDKEKYQNYLRENTSPFPTPPLHQLHPNKSMNDYNWIPFNQGYWDKQKLPEERRYVLLQLPAINQKGMPPHVAVGYLRYAAGCLDSPQFIIPGIGGMPSHWCDCLGDNFFAPSWEGKQRPRYSGITRKLRRDKAGTDPVSATPSPSAPPKNEDGELKR